MGSMWRFPNEVDEPVPGGWDVFVALPPGPRERDPYVFHFAREGDAGRVVDELRAARVVLPLGGSQYVTIADAYAQQRLPEGDGAA